MKQAVALIMVNVMNMTTLVLLLAYGLFNLPIHLWKVADNKLNLYSQLERADEFRKEYRAAKDDFITTVIQCKNMIRSNANENNAIFLDTLNAELPKKDLDGNVISHSGNFYMDLGGKEVTEDVIANVRNQFKIAYFNYKRKKSRWMHVKNNINSLVIQPVEYDEAYLNKDIKNIEKLEEMALKPMPNDQRRIRIYRTLSIASFLFCIFILVTEATVIVDP